MEEIAPKDMPNGYNLKCTKKHSFQAPLKCSVRKNGTECAFKHTKLIESEQDTSPSTKLKRLKMHPRYAMQKSKFATKEAHTHSFHPHLVHRARLTPLCCNLTLPSF